MGMQLNIKGEEAYTLAAELAELTGESLTAAVTQALRERLERERRERDVEARLERIMALGREIRERLGPDVHSWDHNDLYDEDGLPK